MKEWVEINYWYQDWRYLISAMKDPMFSKVKPDLETSAMRANANYVMLAAQLEASRK